MGAVSGLAFCWGDFFLGGALEGIGQPILGPLGAGSLGPESLGGISATLELSG